MGKAAIILVIAAGLTVTYGMMSTQETGRHTAQSQTEYEEGVLAREIARTGFNMAMGILRQHGDSLQAGVNAINGTQGYFEGESQGGVFRASATYKTGHSVEVQATGYFGGAFNGMDYSGATHEIEDNFVYEVSRAPLHVAQCSRLNMNFLMSEAGYCSAVYMERYLPGEDTPQPPEMLFAPGNWRTGQGSGEVDLEKILEAGTQMNFFIGVSTGCRPYSGYDSWNRNDLWKTYDVENHAFNANNYNHIHYAFENIGADISEMEESIWTMIEQHPANNQRWRVAWEDLHRQDWDRPNSTNPAQSLQALKSYGYDGNGWPVTDQWGYRQLRDYGDRPDFGDQVVELWLDPESEDLCEDSAELPGEGEIATEECPCSGNNKILVRHFPPGNLNNPQDICISENGWLGSGNPNANGNNNGQGNSGHKSHSHDYIICTG